MKRRSELGKLIYNKEHKMSSRRNLLQDAITVIGIAITVAILLFILNSCNTVEPVKEISISGKWTSYDISEKATFEQVGHDSADFIIYKDDRGNDIDHQRGFLQKTGANAYKFITDDELKYIELHDAYYEGGRLVMTNGDSLNFMKFAGDF